MIFVALLFVIVLYIMYKVFRLSSKRDKTESSQTEIMKILNEKLAKGEISVEEYFRKKEIIMKN
ncbi:MAG: hypothetical protein H0Z24_04285 [Thermosipho sp. (in: Bacteria)]|nr:hypothetical protein [Thermosipho sp. (in: thermotogales)]